MRAAKAAIIVLIGPRGLGNTQQYERELPLVRQSHDPTFLIVPVILPGTTTDPPFDFLRVLTWIDFSHVTRVFDAPDALQQLLSAIHGEERVIQHAADVTRFVELLLSAARTAPVAVVATVRADFYDLLIGHQEIKSLLPARQVLLGKMLRSELENTLVGPAKKVGLAFVRRAWCSASSMRPVTMFVIMSACQGG